MTAMQRSKGQTGEREIAAIVRDLTGWDVRRRVRQHDGDSDLTGVPGWSIEVKRHASATRGDIAARCRQSVAQEGSDTAGHPRAPAMRPELNFTYEVVRQHINEEGA